MLDYIFLVKALISFFYLFLLTRLMGKKQLAQLTYFDYIVGITIGNFAASMVVEPEIHTIEAMIAVTVWGVLPVAMSILSRQRFFLRRLFEDQPVVVIENGKLCTDILNKENMTVHNVMLMLRKAGHFKLKDIELAILETTGDLSVKTKKNASNVTVNDLKQQNQQQSQEPKILIIEGHILKETMKTLNVTKEWLLAEVKKKGATNLNQVLIAQLQSDGSLYVDIWHEKKEDAL
ncbi:YetF domain-containing protein [Evansella cellulosilytica]|uniref:DUF421 domain-containing protein n=1 Tax=Evansella cellulosilytica (strain ATCC 21833 / DSM 2522 / FERM P-1141 / JCM 9156 / N-4) TaxID=649639 RepID=E6TXG0_EVAC2|nr:DUF421 domain-containing protein [Evansella cellulosilytica]ADU28774.1 protein of unknown function DUF421 [Evansella cellulosilytica DSM 2522]